VQRFSTRSFIIHSGTALVAGSGVSALIFYHPALPAWSVAVPAVAALIYWLVSMRRYLRRLSAGNEPSPAITKVLQERVAFYRRLDEPEKSRFRRDVHYFLLEQTIEGVGIELDDELRALVAASAVILTFGLPHYEWQTYRHILIYKDAFNEDYSVGNDGNVAGLVHSQGPIIFSARSLRAGFTRSTDGHNVGLHEFAHVLDLDDGVIDGVPAHLYWDAVKPWVENVRDELTHNAGKRNKTLRDYGYTNAPEFFAVATEMFFEQPDKLAERAPELHGLLAKFYQQKPTDDTPPQRKRRRRKHKHR